MLAPCLNAPRERACRLQQHLRPPTVSTVILLENCVQIQIVIFTTITSKYNIDIKTQQRSFRTDPDCDFRTDPDCVSRDYNVKIQYRYEIWSIYSPLPAGDLPCLQGVFVCPPKAPRNKRHARNSPDSPAGFDISPRPTLFDGSPSFLSVSTYKTILSIFYPNSYKKAFFDILIPLPGTFPGAHSPHRATPSLKSTKPPVRFPPKKLAGFY